MIWSSGSKKAIAHIPGSVQTVITLFLIQCCVFTLYNFIIRFECEKQRRVKENMMMVLRTCSLLLSICCVFCSSTEILGIRYKVCKPICSVRGCVIIFGTAPCSGC